VVAHAHNVRTWWDETEGWELKRRDKRGGEWRKKNRKQRGKKNSKGGRGRKTEKEEGIGWGGRKENIKD
jgi:hypothetical protein